MNTTKRIISLMMCMLMVLTMVPMSVFAVEATEIDAVHIEGVPAPVYGQTVKEYYTAILDERGGGTLTVNDEAFNKSAGKYGNLFDEGLEVKKNDTVLSSTSTELITEGNYYVAMTLYPADGYVIPAGVAVTVDGAVSVEKDFDEYGSLIVYAKYEVKATEIDTINIEGVLAPQYGDTVQDHFDDMIKKGDDGKCYMKYPKDCWGCSSCIKECKFGEISLYLGADIGGMGSHLSVTTEGDLVHWNIEKTDGTVETIEINRKESNKY